MEFNLSQKATDERLHEFAEKIKELSEQIGFKVSARGWCYQLETERLINKDEFDKVESWINKCRKKSIGFGVNIKTLSIISFNEKEAFDWAKEHKLALKLDTAKFKKLAQVQDISCVSIDDKDTVTITKNIVIGDGD